MGSALFTLRVGLFFLALPLGLLIPTVSLRRRYGRMLARVRLRLIEEVDHEDR